MNNDKKNITHIRDLNSKALVKQLQSSQNAFSSEAIIIKVKISTVDTSSGVPVYNVTILGINDTNTSAIIKGVRGVDDSSTLSLGTICLLVKCQNNRWYILNSSGSGASDSDLLNHIHALHLVYASD